MLGELMRCVSGTFKGLPYRVTYRMPGVIGSYGNPRNIQLSISVDNRLSVSFLSILLRGEDLKPKSLPWKVSINSVNITREYKPQISVSLEGVTYALQVFDVSQIIKEPGKYLLKLSAETSKTIEILAVSLVGVEQTQDTEIVMNYYSGVLVLKKNEKYFFTHPHEGLELGIDIIAEVPSKTSEVAIVCGEEVMTSQLIGISEISLKKLQASQKHMCSVELRKSDVPKPLVLSDLLVYRPLTPAPQVFLDAFLISNKEIRVLVKNEGLSRLSKALVVVLSEGKVLSRDELKDLKPGDTTELRLISPEDLISKEIYVKLIYSDIWGQNIKTTKLKT
ncbi:MAG: hypothetical protein QN229_05645 [Desulfurococcaceae archaeon TW002]